MPFILNRSTQLARLQSGAREQGPILFVSYGAGHAAALAPVALAMHQQGYPVVCLGLTTAPVVFARFGLEAVRMQDVVGLTNSFRRAARIGARLAAQTQAHASIDSVETSTYLGVGFLALVHQYGLRVARRLYRERGRQAFCPTAFFEDFFRAARPSVVVATSAPRSERAAMEAARACGIARLCLIDLYAPFEVQWCASPEYANTICVLTAEVGAHLERHGVPAGRIKVTGNPSFDRLGTLDRDGLRRAFREQRGVVDGMRLVAWISQEEPVRHPFCDLIGDPTLPVQVDDALATYFACDPTVQVIIRPHPNEQREHRALGAHVTFSTRAHNLDELLCGVDCVLTSGSTVGLEAAMLGTPVGQYTQSIFSADLPLAKMGLAEPINSLAEIGPAVLDLFSNNGSAGATVTALRRDVGRAAANVATEIQHLYINSSKMESRNHGSE